MTKKNFIVVLMVFWASLLSYADSNWIVPKDAFAETSFQKERNPVYAIDGSGIGEDDSCGIAHQYNMWMGKNSGNSGGAKFAKWFVVDLGAVYALDRMKIWNFNMNNGQSYASRGVKQIDIYISENDEDFSGTPVFSDNSVWKLFKENHDVAGATGKDTYKGDTPVELFGTKARWVGFWIDTLQGKEDEYGGLSEVRFWEAIGAALSVAGEPKVKSVSEASFFGAVRNSKGVDCDVRLVFGTKEDGEDPSAWKCATEWVPRGDGEFSVDVTDLAPNTEYYAAFSLKRGETEVVYSDIMRFSTAVIEVQIPPNFYESDNSGKNVVFSRPSSASTWPITVAYSIGGSAVSGTDYAELSGSVEFAAGVATTNVVISPIDNDRTDGARSVVVTVLPGCYVAGATGTFSILDDEGDAADCVWTGNGDGTSWENPANWSGQAVPREIDTAIFRSAADVTLSSAQTIRRLVLDNPGALKVSAVADSGATLALAGLERTTSDDSVQTFSLPVLAYAVGDGTNYWNVAGGGEIRFNKGISAGKICQLLKTGTGKVVIAGSLIGEVNLFFWVKEGLLSVTASNAIRGSTKVGGGVVPAILEFTKDDVVAGNQQGTLTVCTNGTANLKRMVWDHCYKNFTVRDGGMIKCEDASFILKATLQGGKIYCGSNNRLKSTTYWGQGIASEASALTSYFYAGMELNHYDSGNPAYITIADGEAPVDLVMKGSFSWTSTSAEKSIEKKGEGVMKMTANNGASSKSPFLLSEGVLLCDSTSGSPIGNTELKVRSGAALGGIGFVGGTERGNVVVAGATNKPGIIAPGTVDEETGAHLYGTLTVGTEAQNNSVDFGNYSRLNIGVGPKNRETRVSDVDKLKVYGVLSIKENCTLDLVKNTAELDSIAGGVYTIVEADKIEGTFASVLKPKDSWKVIYVTEGEGEDAVVKRIDVAIPGKGLTISIR